MGGSVNAGPNANYGQRGTFDNRSTGVINGNGNASYNNNRQGGFDMGRR